MRTIPIVVACLLLAAGQGSAAAAELHDPVTGRADLTYNDLIKLMVTDLPTADSAGEPSAQSIARYRHIEGKDAETEPRGPVAVKYFSPLEIRADGAHRLLILADLGESDMSAAEFVLLGLFDAAAKKPKLLDLIEVGTDRLTGFADQPLLPLGRGSDLIVVRSEHLDAGEDYVDTELIFVRNGRFALAAAALTFSYATCIYQFEETPRIETLPGILHRHFEQPELLAALRYQKLDLLFAPLREQLRAHRGVLELDRHDDFVRDVPGALVVLGEQFGEHVGIGEFEVLKAPALSVGQIAGAHD